MLALRIAWIASCPALIAWLLLTRLAGFLSGAIGWALIAAMLAAATGRVVGGPAWPRRGLGFATAAAGLAIAEQWFPLQANLASAGFVSIAPAYTCIRALRDLNLNRRNAPVPAWLPTTIYGMAVVFVAIIGAMPLLPSAVHRAEDPRAMAAVAQCYSSHVTPWVPSATAGHQSATIVPPRVRLDTARGPRVVSDGRSRPPWGLESEDGRRLMRPAWRGAATWVADSSSGILLSWSTGFHGANARLYRVGTSLVGPIERFTDVIDGRPMPTAWLWLRPASCDGIAPDTAHLVVAREAADATAF